MSRTVPAAFLTALGQGTIEPFYAVDFLFDSPNQLYLWTGLGDKVIGSNTYAGVGELLTISETSESNDLTVSGLTISLSGAKASLVSLALQEPYQNRKCRLLFGLNGQSDVIELFSGRMDKMAIEDGPDSSVITLAVEHKLVALERPVVQRYTDESHKAISSDNSSDTFYSFLADIQDKPVTFGRK